MRIARGLLILFLCVASRVDAALLTHQERSSLRFRLESLLNEVDLLIRNQRVNQSDIRRQRKEAVLLRVYDRIPFQKDTRSLQRELRSSANESGLKVRGFKWLPQKRSSAPEVPKWVYTDAAPFKLTPEQLVDVLPFRMRLEGPLLRMDSWIRNWHDNLIRLVVPVGGYQKPVLVACRRSKGGTVCSIEGHAFVFRTIKFPRLVPRDPLDHFPPGAKRDIERFARLEPFLWGLTTQIRELTPKTHNLYEARQEFLLNRARMEFVFSFSE